MKCNACWQDLEGQAISTTCGHLLCTEDARKILSNDGACPICDQVLSKSSEHVVWRPTAVSVSTVLCDNLNTVNLFLVSLMKPVDVDPSDDWTNMAMVGISPQTLMKSAYRSIMFYIGQKELVMQYKMNQIVGQCRQKIELMQGKFTQKLEELHGAYQKMGKKCQMMEQEIENLTKDKQELQEKFAEKSRQKRKLDEMYDQLRTEYESLKRSAIQPANNLFPRAQPNLFTGMPNMMDNSNPLRQGSVFSPETPGRKEEMWAPGPRQRLASSDTFEISGASAHMGAPTVDVRPRKPAGPGFGAGTNNSSAALRNMLISPMKRPHVSRNRPHMFA
ncbi:hypothetical protein ACP70R_043198 [Stipagrostis hirtigluma subsp. patula]